MPTSGGATLRTVAVTIGVTSLLVVVALTAGSMTEGPAGGRAWQIDRAATSAVVRQILFVAYLAVLAHAFYLWLTQGSRRGRSASRRPGAPALGILLFLLLLLFLAVFRLVTLENGAGPEEGARPTLTTVPSPDFEGGGAPLPGGVPGSTPAPDWPVLAAGLALVGIAVAVVVARRRPAPGGSELRTPSPPEAVTGPHPVQPPPPIDPRERVFAAYRTVEDAAGRTGGRRRHPSETVSAHLSRLTSPGPAAADPLASLYNRARFSSHPIGAVDASRAEQAGAEIRRRLR